MLIWEPHPYWIKLCPSYILTWKKDGPSILLKGILSGRYCSISTRGCRKKLRLMRQCELFWKKHLLKSLLPSAWRKPLPKFLPLTLRIRRVLRWELLQKQRKFSVLVLFVKEIMASGKVQFLKRRRRLNEQKCWQRTNSVFPALMLTTDSATVRILENALKTVAKAAITLFCMARIACSPAKSASRCQCALILLPMSPTLFRSFQKSNNPQGSQSSPM